MLWPNFSIRIIGRLIEGIPEMQRAISTRRLCLLRVGLRIRIGLYPAVVYVSPPGDKELMAAEAKREEDRKDSLSAFLARNEEDRLKGPKGKERAELKTQIERWRADSDAVEKQYLKQTSNPCQPLNSVFP
jgi:hypothetical protein